LLDALMDQAAVAIERVRLVEDLDRSRTAETDRLRSALLTSISHDLKTPLAAVLRAAGTLRSMSDALDEHAKADLVATMSTVQLERARALLDAMKAETIPLGERLISKEANLDRLFASRGSRLKP
jgi:two-component system sensor histidine kinase KdpD